MSRTDGRTGSFADRIGVLAVVVGLVLGLLPGVAAAGHGGGVITDGQFEIDGNLPVDTSGNHDWVGAAGIGDEFRDGTEKSVAGFADSGQGDTTWFKASTVEGDYPGWRFTDKGNADKSDLHRLFVGSQVAGAESFLWLGASRISDNGNTQVTVEFNQDELAVPNDFTRAYRRTNDVWIRFNFPGKQSADTVTVSVSQWGDGNSTGAYTNVLSLAPGEFEYALGGLQSGAQTDFIELQLSLEAIFGEGGLGLQCADFGTVSFRTESSGGSDDNNQPTLKDIAGPYPVDLDTCADVEVRKVDEDGAPLDGAEFSVYSGHGAAATGTPVATCVTGPDATDVDGTEASGACSFGPLLPGDYTLHETGVPDGYEPSPDLPADVTVERNTSLVLGPYTDPRVPYTISVVDDATNALDDTDAAASEHPFTVTLTDDEGGLAGETVQLDWTGTGEIVRINGVDGSGTSCTTRGDGTCAVVVNTSQPGSGTLTASWDTPYQRTVASPDPLPSTTADGDGTVAYPTIADAATKVWVGLDASIAATATNLLGDPHTFVVTVWEVDGRGADDGSEPGSRVGGATVEVTWAGPDGSTIDGAAGAASCTTDATGVCRVQVDSDTDGGTGTATVTSVAGAVTGGETARTTFVAGERTADKTWRIYRALIDDDSVNPAGQTHPFTVTVQYSDDGGATWENPGSGIVVAWDDPDGVNDLASSTCDDGTDAAGTCTIVVYSDAPGAGTVTVTAVDGDLLLDGGTTADGPADVPDVSATKTWLAFAVDIDPAAVNLVGDPHVFRVEVSYSDGGDYEPVPAGTRVAWSDAADPRVTGDTCSTGTGDDPATAAVETDVCFITVSSDAPGTLPITVSGVEDFQFTGRTEDVDFGTPGTTTKTWVDYRASISPDGVNLLGVEHEMVVLAEQDRGDGWEPVPAGTTVTVTSSGVGTIDTLTCETVGATGTCVVTVDSDTQPGDRTVTVATVQADDVDGDPVVPVTDASSLADGQSLSATKTWIDYAATISGDATNLAGDAHVFRVEAVQDAGTGDQPVPTGTVVGVELSDATNLVDDGCAVGTGDDPATPQAETNVCFVTVTSSTVDTVDVTVDTVQARDVDPVDGRVQVDDVVDQTSTKTWVEVLVTITDDEINVVGEPHTFVLDVDVVTPDGPPNAEPTAGTLVVTTSGPVGSETDQTCDDGLDADGTCTVTVLSSAAGDRVVTAERVTFTHAGTTFTDVELDGATGVAAASDPTATKTWRDFRVDVAADGLNLVRDEHTFTVTVEQTDDGTTWGPVPDGTTATVAFGPTGAITGGTCDTTGTDGGACSVVVDSDGAGTGMLAVSAISVDLPEEGRTDIPVTVTGDADGDTSESKTWVAFRGLISPDSVNITGDPHDFTLTAQYTTDGSTWLDVPDGSTITYRDGGDGRTDRDTCGSTVGGDCTVTVRSSTSGVRTITVTGVDPAPITATVGGTSVRRDFGLVDVDDATATGVQPGTDVTVTATKTWASYTLTLTPADAVNLLSGAADDPERYHTITVTLRSDDAASAPVGDQAIMVDITGTGVIDAVEDGVVAADGLTATCVTATDGTCDVVIFSATPGRASVDAQYRATVGDSAPVTIDADAATKTWTTFRVTVTPEEAVNLVGNPHVFTVTVEQSNPAGDCDGDWCPVVGAVPTIEVSGVDLTVDATDCEAGTDARGQCTVSVTSDTVQAVTLTATHTEELEDDDAEVAGRSTVGFTDTGDKDWIDHAIDVDPPLAENLVGTDHVFTVTVTTTYPTADGTRTDPVAGVNPAVSLSGVGSIRDTTCDDEAGTDAAGQCTVTITGSVPGGSKLTATYTGTAADDAEARAYTDSGDKLWVDYLLALDADATNRVGDPHTFTATLTVDTGRGFGPAAGERLQFKVGGVGGAVGGDVDQDLACTTGEDGTCRIVVDSDVVGETTVDVTHDAVVGGTTRTDTDRAVKTWVDIRLEKTAVVGDGLADGDLLDDPEGAPFLFFTSSDRGPKTAVYEYSITNPSSVPLTDVQLVDAFDFDDTARTVDLSLFPACEVLEPGETCTARSRAQFDYTQAIGELAGLTQNVATVDAVADGVAVSASDDAEIALVAVQSSVLIDLQKDVVEGGDVLFVDGRPIVSWSEEEYDSGVAKAVTYRFTVTNISNATIVDVELLDPMLSDEPLVSLADGLTLAPDESVTLEVEHMLTVEEAFPTSPIADRVDNVATVRGANETRDAFTEDSDEASVLTELVFARVLPATGLDTPGLVPVAMLFVTLGIAVLWLERRRTRVG